MTALSFGKAQPGIGEGGSVGGVEESEDVSEFMTRTSRSTGLVDRREEGITTSSSSA
jgi:hypothetical protein